MLKAHYRIPVIWLLLFVFEFPANAQKMASKQKAVSNQEAETGSWKKYYLRRASDDYAFYWTEKRLPLELRREPIVNWTNPLEEGQINGSTFVWEHEGRPIVIGQLFSYRVGDGKRSLCHVFSSLTDETISGERNGRVFFEPAVPKESGWQTFSAAGNPAEQRSGRLLQMRRLARGFEAFTEEASRGKRELRLLQQPLYRTDEDLKDYDAGLFAYVVGTDPELLILIECDDSADVPKWRYRMAQSTRSTTVATFQKQTVYRYESSERVHQTIHATYLSHHGIDQIPADF
ncbi:hypothetical protein [Roseiconus lacunae]|uniref:hypothetical protein n=1 Tax=Roseiconus lacunae TaxID=2605694 RepID=UPI001E567514|nr:hypothetical protein [Roseiconus lacunae]MCD0460624.1 hypothetical protein [Roseiconus lacunae]